MSVRENLRSQRKKHRFSQKQLSELTGVAQSTISAIELGQQNPSVETLRKLAAGVECSVSELMGGGVMDEEEREYQLSLPEDLMQALRKMKPGELRRVKDFADGVIAGREGGKK